MVSKIVAVALAIISLMSLIIGAARTESEIIPMTDVSYGGERRQTFDLYLPERLTGRSGLVLFIHGGAWLTGDKSSYTNRAVRMASVYGFASATMNYRYLSERVNFYGILDDITAALAKIKELAAGRGVQLDRVLLTGISAGAHLSLLYGYTRVNAAPITPVAVVSYCGPTDFCDPNFYNGTLTDMPFETVNELLAYSVGPGVTVNNVTDPAVAAAQKPISPLYNVSASTVPTVIGHGTRDVMVPYSNAVSLDAALTAANVRHDFITFPNSGHSLNRDPEQADKMFSLLVEYASDYLIGS